ncbi:hypothetical protein [Halothiobacillus sp.]|nr:hypothetical protein [Halothiobacillus sp.]
MATCTDDDSDKDINLMANIHPQGAPNPDDSGIHALPLNNKIN